MMKKMISLLLALTLLLSLGSVAISAYENSTPIYFSFADESGNIVWAKKEISIADVNNDGQLTIYDAFYCAHELLCPDGADGFKTINTEFGLFIVKFWGVENGGSYGYYLNDQMAYSLLDPIESFDHLYAYIYTDLDFWTDSYGYFSGGDKTVKAGDTLDMHLYHIAFDDDGMPFGEGVENAKILVNGEETEITTGVNGDFSISFDQPGRYVVSAYVEKKYETVEVQAPNGTPVEKQKIVSVNLVPPIAIIDVKPNVLWGDVDGDGRLTILDATLIQMYLADLIDLTDEQQAIGKVGGGEKLEITDVTLIQQKLAELITVFPVEAVG